MQHKCIIISNHISTQTYNSNLGSKHLSFITDVKNRIEYVLKNEIACLWDFIVKSQNYDLIRQYAVNNQLDNILDDFLYQLKNLDIINTDLTFPHNNCNYFLHKISFNDENYLYFKKSQARFFRKNHFIKNLFLILNYKCNLKCRHCCSYKNVDEIQITFDQAKKIIDEACNLGIYEIVLTGGECTLNNDFLKIAKYIRNKHINLTIKTNGQKLYDDENLFNEIINIYPLNVHLSLYSIKPEIHDNMTQVKGSHHKTLSVLKKLKSNNIRVVILNFISNYNKYSNDELLDFTKKTKINYLSTCSFINNQDNNNLDAALSLSDIEKIYLKNLDSSLKYKEFEKNDKPFCDAGIIQICIEPDLNIIPCAYTKYSLGNYNNLTLKELNEKILPEFRKVFNSNNLTECFKYDYCKYCGYCIAMASHDKGVLKKSEMLCRLAKAVHKYLLLHNKKINS